MKVLLLLTFAFFIGCAPKPKPAASLPDLDLAFDQAEVPMKPDPNESILPLEPPNWTIYFDFDSFSLKELYKVGALAEYMKKTGACANLSGHTSQEGTYDYNMALGARRAMAVRDYLEAYGIDPGCIQWVSFGEEKPVTEDREKYPLNRRVEITLEDLL